MNDNAFRITFSCLATFSILDQIIRFVEVTMGRDSKQLSLYSDQADKNL